MRDLKLLKPILIRVFSLAMVYVTCASFVPLSWFGCSSSQGRDTATPTETGIASSEQETITPTGTELSRVQRLLQEETTFFFPGNSLKYIASMLTDYYKIEIQVEPAIQDLEVEIECTGTLSECLNQLSNTSGIHWAETQNGIRLVKHSKY